MLGGEVDGAWWPRSDGSNNRPVVAMVDPLVCGTSDGGGSVTARAGWAGSLFFFTFGFFPKDLSLSSGEAKWIGSLA